MSGPIQTIPQGLLGLLQLKQTGSNPSELLDTVQAIIDLFPLWIQRNSVELAVSTLVLATASPGGSQPFTPAISVPNGFTWYVQYYSLRANLLAADTIRFAPTYVAAGATQVTVLDRDVQDTITARARAITAVARGFWLSPGDSLSVAVFDDLTAGNITINGAVRGVQIPI